MVRSFGGGTTFVSSKMPGRDRARPSNCFVLNFDRPFIVAFTLFLPVLAAISFAAESPRDSDYDYDPPAAGSYSLPVIKPAADGALLDSDNKAIKLRDLTHGRVTVLSFIYTRCAAPKGCPYATGVLTQLYSLSAEDKTLAENMRLVSISFDPEYDTPQRLADYSEW